MGMHHVICGEREIAFFFSTPGLVWLGLAVSEQDKVQLEMTQMGNYGAHCVSNYAVDWLNWIEQEKKIYFAQSSKIFGMFSFFFSR